jgi:hypothetical protein
VYKKFGFTGQAIADKAKKLTNFYANTSVPNLLAKPF